MPLFKKLSATIYDDKSPAIWNLFVTFADNNLDKIRLDNGSAYRKPRFGKALPSTAVELPSGNHLSSIVE
jgi:hypothetical protein